MISEPNPHAQEEFFNAIRSGNLVQLEKSAKEDPKLVETMTPNGFTPLIIAAYNNQVDVVALLIRLGANTDAQDHSGNTALIGACFKGYIDIIKLLIENGSNPNLTNYTQSSALIFAATYGHLEIVQYLLNHKANASHKDGKGQTALDYAHLQENKAIVTLLS
ncbi:ankyrin repeat domain-containing protein [Flavobacterium sp. '19STA2R22 D10 B1']|uniref:ankyrin repeat domain-containing protein n=1 Tax=Flavobacterium aerium TaxID=3037261 RepID=UPI00278C641B|nr:ankyrin repeat domain-containing protein [Flavobacterium sp. '19STA2R22 D10 B1']